MGPIVSPPEHPAVFTQESGVPATGGSTGGGVNEGRRYGTVKLVVPQPRLPEGVAPPHMLALSAA
jgi:hypothetical protein